MYIVSINKVLNVNLGNIKIYLGSFLFLGKLSKKKLTILADMSAKA